MKRVLILTLGTGRFEKDGEERLVSRYLEANYTINGKAFEHTRYVAEPLIREYNPDEIIVLGTVCSGWGGFYVAFSELKSMDFNAHLNDPDYQYLYKLETDKSRFNKDTSVDDLKPIQDRITAIFKSKLVFGDEVDCSPDIHPLLLRYGLSDEQLSENYDIMAGISEILGDEPCDVAFDITHSFRSLPLYNLAVITYLKSCRNENIKISHVYYGNLEVSRENDGIAPIVDLVDLIRVLDMSSAIEEFVNAGSVISMLDEFIESEGELKAKLHQFDHAILFNSFSDIDFSIKELLEEVDHTRESTTRYVQLREMIRSVLRNKMFASDKSGSLSEIYDSMDVIDKRVMISKWCANQGRYGQALVNCMELFRSIVTPVYVEIRKLEGIDTESDENCRKNAEDYFRKRGRVLQKQNNPDEICRTVMDVIVLVEKYKDIRNIFAHTLIRSNNDLMWVTSEDLNDFIDKLCALRRESTQNGAAFRAKIKAIRDDSSDTDSVSEYSSDFVRLIVGIGDCRIDYSPFFNSVKNSFEVYTPGEQLNQSLVKYRSRYWRGICIAEYWNRYFANRKGEIIFINADSEDATICALALRELGYTLGAEVTIRSFTPEKSNYTISLKESLVLSIPDYENVRDNIRESMILDEAPIQKKKHKLPGSVFINFSNHPSDNWDAAQLNAARQLGSIIDIPFPAVKPDATETEIKDLADEVVQDILRLIPGSGTVMVQGEFSLSISVINRLKPLGIKTVCACTDRVVTGETDENGGTVKKSVFKFKGFREY